MRLFSTFVSILLVPLVAVMPLRAELGPATGHAASGEAAAASTTDQSKVLKLRLADENRAAVEANSISVGYAILVTDAGGLPVSGVAVSVRLPEEGASGYFTDGEHAGVAYTDATGLARFPQLNWGSSVGVVSIRVTAAKGDLHAGMIIDQTVVARRTAPAAVPASPVAAFPNTAAASGSSEPASTAAARTAPVTPTAASGVAAAPSVAPATKMAGGVKQPDVVKQPGVPTSVASVQSGATPEEAAAGKNQAGTPRDATVSVVNTAGSQGTHSNKKWIILAAVVASAGVGAALALSGKGGAGAAASAAPTTTIGAPTVNVGH